MRGPAGATRLTLDRLGWESEDGITFVDDLRIKRTLTAHSPKMWKLIIQQSVQRSHERELALKVGANDTCGQRLCADAVKKVLASSKTPSDGKLALATAACNGVWTKVRATEASFEVDSLKCHLCQADSDTLHHRLWQCQHSEVVKARAVHASPESAPAYGGA